MRIADTSFLYALFHANDRFHPKARSHAFQADRILIPSEVWTETMGLMLARLGFEATVQVKQWIGSHPTFEFAFSGAREHQLAWRLYQKARGALSLTDALVIAWGNLEVVPLLSFDANQLKAAGQG